MDWNDLEFQIAVRRGKIENAIFNLKRLLVATALWIVICTIIALF